MAPPDRTECNPISSFVNPRRDSPMMSTTARNLGSACEEFIHEIFPLGEINEHIFESSVAPGIFKTLFTVNAAATTGHSRSSPVRNMWTEWFLQSFF